MQNVNLTTLDLNLLVALEVLLQERHITKSADRLNMSQPTMSRILSRLREAFDDQLLVRTPQGYVKTPRAEKLEDVLAETLSAARRTFAKPAFDPETATNVFRISTTDYGEAVILPTLTQLLQQTAPSVELEISQRDMYSVADVQSGGVDVSIGIMPQSPTEGCVTRKLIEDRYVCVMCADHPLAKQDLTVASYLACGHLVLAAAGGEKTPVDLSLSEIGLRRRVVRRSYHSLASLCSLKNTELLQTTVQRLADILVKGQKLNIKELPFVAEPVVFHLIWHARNNEDPAHKWLRELLQEAADLVAGA